MCEGFASSQQEDHHCRRHRQKRSRGDGPVHHRRKKECAEYPKPQQQRIRCFLLDEIGYCQRENPNSDGSEQSSFGRDCGTGSPSESARHPEIKYWAEGEGDRASANNDLPRVKEGRIEESRKEASRGE